MSEPTNATEYIHTIEPAVIREGVTNVVENLNPLAPDTMNPRQVQQTIQPAAAKGRNVRVIQTFNTLTVSTTIADGQSAISTTITNNNLGNRLVQLVSTQIYIGQVGIGFRMPEDISSANYPFYAWNSLYAGTSTTSPIITDSQASYKVQVRNNSGSSQLIFFQILTRYIVNDSNSTS